MVQKKGKINAVFIYDISGGGTKLIGSSGDELVKPINVQWGSNSRLLVTVLAPLKIASVRDDLENKKDFDYYDYTLFARILAMDVDTNNKVFLMDNLKEISKNYNLSTVKHFLPHDSDNVLMTAYRGNRKALYKVNILTGKAHRLATGTRHTVAFLNEENGDLKYRVDYYEYLKQIEIYEHEEGLTWRRNEVISIDDSAKEEIDIDGLVGLYNDELVYRKRNDVSGFYELVMKNSKTNKLEVLVSLKNQNVYGTLISNRTNNVLGYITETDYIYYHFFDSEVQKFYDKVSVMVGKYNFWLSNYDPEANELIVYTSGMDNPGTFYLADMKNEELSMLGYLHEGLNPETLAMPAITSIKMKDNKVIRTYILLPLGFQKGQSYPMILLPHGGPHSRDRAQFNRLAQFIASLGYIVIKPNFRGSSGYGKKFEESGYRQWGLKMQDDINAAVDFMVDKGYANKDKVCIVGGSYGGYAALMGLIKTPKKYQCGISINGVTDLSALIEHEEDIFNDDELIEKFVYQTIGHPEYDKKMLEANSPIYHVKKLLNPY